jgi:hypothetical protein
MLLADSTEVWEASVPWPQQIFDDFHRSHEAAPIAVLNDASSRATVLSQTAAWVSPDAVMIHGGRGLDAGVDGQGVHGFMAPCLGGRIR